MGHHRQKMRSIGTSKKKDEERRHNKEKKRTKRDITEKRVQMQSEKQANLLKDTRKQHVSMEIHVAEQQRQAHTHSSKFSTDFDLRGFTLPTKPLLYSQPLQMNANTVTRFMLTQKDKTRKENFKNSEKTYNKQTLLSTDTSNVYR